ncbi:DUF2195 family protein [Bordetella muralis]
MLLAAALTGTAAQAAGPIKVENALAQCVALQPGVRTTTGQQVVTEATLTVKKSIGECGCKSAIATYTSQVEMEGGYRSFLQRGALLVKESGVQPLTLASSAQLLGDRGVVLSLACAGPD